jgi:uncharacterized SAM-binding protein YcdF (DUF218 family)
MAVVRAEGRWSRLGVGLAVGGLAGLVAVDLDLPSLASMWGDRTLLVPLFAVAGALLWLTPLRRLVAGLAWLLAVLWIVVAFTPLTSWLAQGLVRRDPVEAADAVYVFSSQVQEDGDPSANAMSRLFEGLELLAEGRASRLIVSEVPPPAGAYEPLARAWVARFVPRAEVLSLGRIHNTHDEGVALARLFRAKGWKRVLAVTSPTHTRRAAAVLEKQGLAVVSVPAAETLFDLRGPHPGDRREAFAAVAHERIGYVVYRHRGWVD